MSLYEILQVVEGASSEEIRAAYLRLVQQHHPDRHVGETNQALHDRFKEIQRAYEVLHDPDQREAYDRQRSIPKPKPRGAGNGRANLHPNPYATRQGPRPVDPSRRRDVPDDWLDRGALPRRKRPFLVAMFVMGLLTLAVLVVPECSRELEKYSSEVVRPYEEPVVVVVREEAPIEEDNTIAPLTESEIKELATTDEEEELHQDESHPIQAIATLKPISSELLGDSDDAVSTEDAPDSSASRVADELEPYQLVLRDVGSANRFQGNSFVDFSDVPSGPFPPVVNDEATFGNKFALNWSAPLPNSTNDFVGGGGNSAARARPNGIGHNWPGPSAYKNNVNTELVPRDPHPTPDSQNVVGPGPFSIDSQVPGMYVASPLPGLNGPRGRTSTVLGGVGAHNGFQSNRFQSNATVPKFELQHSPVTGQQNSVSIARPESAAYKRVGDPDQFSDSAQVGGDLGFGGGGTWFDNSTWSNSQRQTISSALLEHGGTTERHVFGQTGAQIDYGSQSQGYGTQQDSFSY